jgi:hypothetical protein
MVAAGCLPVAWENGQLFFLFGKEAYGERTPGYSDFAGGMERGDASIYDGALREMAEETTGFFGDAAALNRLIRDSGGTMHIPMGENRDYHIHIFRMAKDPAVVDCYNRCHAFIYDHVRNHTFLKSTKIFEKIRIDWMTQQDMRRRRREFRPFYRAYVDQLLARIDEIETFVVSRPWPQRSNPRSGLQRSNCPRRGLPNMTTNLRAVPNRQRTQKRRGGAALSDI